MAGVARIVREIGAPFYIPLRLGGECAELIADSGGIDIACVRASWPR